MGPGRYSDMPAMISSKHPGFMLARNERMPADSSWNTPSVSPREIIAYTPGSSMGMSSGFMSGPPFSFTISSASPMTFSVRSPRKSIFKRPSASSVPMGNWVVITSSLVCSGT